LKSYLQALLFIIGSLFSAVSVMQIMNDRRFSGYTYSSLPLSPHEKTYALNLGAGLILMLIGLIIMLISTRSSDKGASNHIDKPYIDFKKNPFNANKIFMKPGRYLDKMAEHSSEAQEETRSVEIGEQGSGKPEEKIPSAAEMPPKPLARDISNAAEN